MESETRRSSTRNQIKKGELPLDMPNLAMSYVRQNNDLRKTLRRFEQEKKKHMKTIDGDIWELQKFMQDLKCVTAISAEDILFRQRRPSMEHLSDTSRDKTKNSQVEKLTARSTEGLSNIASSVSIMKKMENSDSKNARLFTSSSKSEESFWRHSERRRSSSVGEMCSGTLERLNAIAGYNQQPLLQRRRGSLDVGKGAAMKMSFEHTVEKPIEPFMRAENVSGNSVDINEHLKIKCLANKAESISDGFSFENGKSNAVQRGRRRSVLYQRAPSTVMEEESVEEVSQENEHLTITVPDKTHSKTNLPSPTVPEIPEIPQGKDGGRLLTRKSTGKLFIKRSSLGVREVNDSNIADGRMLLTRSSYPPSEKDAERKLLRQGTFYKENTTSRLRKQNSKDSVIGLSLKGKNKSFRREQSVGRNIKSASISTSLKAAEHSPKIKFHDDIIQNIPTEHIEFPKPAKSLVVLISPQLHRKDRKRNGSAEPQQR
ncbi:hypothetical protein OS493_030908 [Desmophyllum pertusum]|uniref:Uncharacterized protein n=1 Tax=Desmophyllum pertusum TaxID=174260 RepID=A0A9W9ZX72_9CNID|nr:hypothetical protein OS493_030908 [Desmophyllum pertusum]